MISILLWALKLKPGERTVFICIILLWCVLSRLVYWHGILSVYCCNWAFLLEGMGAYCSFYTSLTSYRSWLIELVRVKLRIDGLVRPWRFWAVPRIGSLRAEDGQIRYTPWSWIYFRLALHYERPTARGVRGRTQNPIYGRIASRT